MALNWDGWTPQNRKQHMLGLKERLERFVARVDARNRGEEPATTPDGVWKAPSSMVSDGDARFMIAMINHCLADVAKRTDELGG